MCQSKAEGGKRCEYADQLANVRRNAQYKHRNTPAYKLNEVIQKEVDKWKEANPELVRAHLPARQPFNVTPNKKPVPAELMELLTPHSRIPVTGKNREERLAHTKQMFEDQEAWSEKLTREEYNAVKHYTMSGYERVNLFLRRKGFTRWAKNNPYDGGVAETAEKTKETVTRIDSALQKRVNSEGPRRVYRYFEVPAGVSPTEYLNRYFQEGGGFKDLGYMSTTEDPEFIMAHMYKQNSGSKNKKFVVMEILTNQGQSLQPDEASRSGDIQSLEKEVLLPRNMKFRVTSVRKRQTFQFGSDRKDLYAHYERYWNDSMYERFGGFKEGEKMSFPLIQMVDERLINPRSTPQNTLANSSVASEKPETNQVENVQEKPLRSFLKKLSKSK